MKVFITIGKRFLKSELVLDFLIKFTTMCFSMLPGLRKKTKKKVETKGKKPILVGKALAEQKAIEEEENKVELDRKLKKSIIIMILI